MDIDLEELDKLKAQKARSGFKPTLKPRAPASRPTAPAAASVDESAGAAASSAGQASHEPPASTNATPGALHAQAAALAKASAASGSAHGAPVPSHGGAPSAMRQHAQQGTAHATVQASSAPRTAAPTASTGQPVSSAPVAPAAAAQAVPAPAAPAARPAPAPPAAQPPASTDARPPADPLQVDSVSVSAPARAPTPAPTAAAAAPAPVATAVAQRQAPAGTALPSTTAPQPFAPVATPAPAAAASMQDAPEGHGASAADGSDSAAATAEAAVEAVSDLLGIDTSALAPRSRKFAPSAGRRGAAPPASQPPAPTQASQFHPATAVAQPAAAAHPASAGPVQRQQASAQSVPTAAPLPASHSQQPSTAPLLAQGITSVSAAGAAAAAGMMPPPPARAPAVTSTSASAAAAKPSAPAPPAPPKPVQDLAKAALTRTQPTPLASAAAAAPATTSSVRPVQAAPAVPKPVSAPAAQAAAVTKPTSSTRAAAKASASAAAPHPQPSAASAPSTLQPTASRPAQPPLQPVAVSPLIERSTRDPRTGAMPRLVGLSGTSFIGPSVSARTHVTQPLVSAKLAGAAPAGPSGAGGDAGPGPSSQAQRARAKLARLGARGRGGPTDTEGGTTTAASDGGDTTGVEDEGETRRREAEEVAAEGIELATRQRALLEQKRKARTAAAKEEVDAQLQQIAEELAKLEARRAELAAAMKSAPMPSRTLRLRRTRKRAAAGEAAAEEGAAAAATAAGTAAEGSNKRKRSRASKAGVDAATQPGSPTRADGTLQWRKLLQTVHDASKTGDQPQAQPAGTAGRQLRAAARAAAAAVKPRASRKRPAAGPPGGEEDGAADADTESEGEGRAIVEELTVTRLGRPGGIKETKPRKPPGQGPRYHKRVLKDALRSQRMLALMNLQEEQAMRAQQAREAATNPERALVAVPEQNQIVVGGAPGAEAGDMSLTEFLAARVRNAAGLKQPLARLLDDDDTVRDERRPVRLPQIHHEVPIDLKTWSLRRIIARTQAWDRVKTAELKAADEAKRQEAQKALEAAEREQLEGLDEHERELLAPNGRPLPPPMPNAGDAVAAPKVTVGEDGRLVILEESRTVIAQQTEVQNYARVEEDGRRTLNSFTYMKRGSNERWSPEETALFYRALRAFGTDFTVIAQLFPARDRRNIKAKFSKEERESPQLISESMKRNAVDPKDKSLLMEIVRANIIARGAQTEKERAAMPGLPSPAAVPASPSHAAPSPGTGAGGKEGSVEPRAGARAPTPVGQETAEEAAVLQGGVLGAEGLPTATRVRRAAPKVAAARRGAQGAANSGAEQPAAAAAAQVAAEAAAAEAGYEEDVYAY